MTRARFLYAGLSRRLPVFSTVVLFLLLTSATTAVAQAKFRFTSLGVLAGGNGSFANGVNDSGQVAGGSNQAAGGFYFATRYNGSAWQLIGTVTGYTTSSTGNAINAAGHVAGSSNNGTNDQAFYWGGSGAPVGLGFLPGGTISQGADINDSDVVTGRSTTSGGASSSNRAYTWTSGGGLFQLPLPMPPTVPTIWQRQLGQGINNAGLVAGYGRQATPPPGNRAFIYTPGPMTYQVLGDFGGDFTIGNKINGLGHVIGYSDVTAAGPTDAFLWDGTTMNHIPHLAGATSAQAIGMNDRDQVVGIDGSGTFFYSAGTTYDLSTLLVAGSPFTALANAFDINFHGQIVGTGVTASGNLGYLATPELHSSGGSGAWTAGTRFSYGITPAWPHPVYIDGATTVNGPAANTQIAELAVGGTTAGVLVLGNGAITVTKSSSPVTATWATGATTVAANGTARFTLTAPGTARIVTDTVTLAAGSTLDFTGAASLASYVLISNTGARTGTFTNVTNLPAGYSVVYTASQVRIDQAAMATGIARQTPSGALTNAASVTWRVTFNQPVSGVTSSNFTTVPGGGLGGTSMITGVAAVGGSPATQWDVTATTGTGAGTLNLNFSSTAGISPAIASTLSGGAGSQYTIDKVAPTVTSIVRVGASPTSASMVDFTVTFSESVNGGANANFAATTGGLGGSPAVMNVTGSGTTRTVTASTGSGTGALYLDAVSSAGITDAAGNTVSGLPATGQAYWVDRTGAIAVTVPGISPTQNVSFSGPVATATDTNASTPASDLGAIIDWGDGSPVTAGVVSGSSGSFSVAGTHTYATAGNMPLVVTVFSQKLHAALDGVQEVPRRATAGTGTGTATLSADRTMVTIDLSFATLGSNASGAAVQSGAPLAAGTDVFTLASVPAATTGTVPSQAFGLSAPQLNLLLTNQVELNVGTTGFASGEIRGQLLGDGTATGNGNAAVATPVELLGFEVD